MSERKARLTVTVDGGLIEAGSRAVNSGRADSLSGWVNQALVEQVLRERRREALSDAVAGYEAKHGVMTDLELLGASRSRDVVEAALALLTKDGDHLLTSDPHDLAALVAAAGRHVDVIGI